MQLHLKKMKTNADYSRNNRIRDHFKNGVCLKNRRNKGVFFMGIIFCASTIFSGCGTIYHYSNSAVNANRMRYVTSVNSYGNYNLSGKTFYIESGDKNISSNDVEFREYAKYVAKSLVASNARETLDKKNADMCVLVNYGISDESYMETVPFPVWGPTGISSINTTSQTNTSAYGSAYGNATRIGNSTYGSAYGSGYGNATTQTTTNVNHTYGITGYTSIDRKVTSFRRVLNVYAYDNKNTSEPQ